ncbi:MAG TPA: hypothetical protein V6C57_19535 [Coleofasciculaceae cyanobacterium]
MYKFESDEGLRKGLATWAYFILFFFFVGLRADLCILLGAIAGLAVWNIVGYLQAEELPAPDPAKAEEEPQPSVFRQVGTRVFDRFRRSRLTDNERPDVISTPRETGPRRGRVIGLRRPPKRYLGKRPPKRIGR